MSDLAEWRVRCRNDDFEDFFKLLGINTPEAVYKVPICLKGDLLKAELLALL